MIDTEPTITLNPAYLKVRKLNGEEVKEGLLVRDWSITTPHSKHFIPGIGTTAHQGMVSAIQVSEKEIGVFAKPFENFDAAVMEYQNANAAHKRGIATPPMIALVSQNEGAIVVSHLDQTAEPLSLCRVDYQLQDPRLYTPQQFLSEYLSFIAGVHNAGIALGDLHLGNIGRRRRIGRPHSPIIFDLETAMVLGEHELNLKNNHTAFNGYVDRWQMFERMAVSDIASFLANLEAKGDFPIQGVDLLDEGEQYTSFRKPSYGLLDSEEFKDQLATSYRKILLSILS